MSAVHETLLTIPAVAARLACSRPHVYALIESGELMSVDIARPGSTQSKTRVKESDLANYIDTISSR